MGAALGRRGAGDPLGRRPAARIVVHHPRAFRPARCIGQQERARGAVDGNAPDPPDVDPPGELVEQVGKRAPPQAGILLDAQALAAG